MRARVPLKSVSPGAVTDSAAAAGDTPPRLFGSSAPRLGVLLGACVCRARRSHPLADALSLSLPSPPQKGKMAQAPTFKLILVGDGGTGACARLPRASEASRSAAERLVFKI